MIASSPFPADSVYSASFSMIFSVFSLAFFAFSSALGLASFFAFSVQDTRSFAFSISKILVGSIYP
jgi:hypothetical protein